MASARNADSLRCTACGSPHQGGNINVLVLPATSGT